MTFTVFMQTIAQYAVVGFFLSVIIEATKGWLTNATHRTIFALAVSVVGGLLIYFAGFIPESYFTVAIGVIGAVNTMYLIVVQYIPFNSPASA